MDTATEQYYRNMLDMFQTPGWKQFVEECELHASAANNVLSVPDASELHKRQGRLEVLFNIINMEHQVDNTMQELQQEQQDD